jgi:hypothetical protein
MIDAELEQVHAWTRVPDDVARRYAMQTDRDPRKSGAWMRFLLPRPLRIPGLAAGQ